MTSLDVFGFVDEATSNMYDWLRWVVERNLPLSEVENPLTRQLVKIRPTTAETLKTYMRRVADRVGQAIAKEVTGPIGLMFDRWSSGSLHFVAVFAVYHSGQAHCERLIALSPMDDGQTAEAHIVFLTSVLALYNLDISAVKFLVGENCATNQCVATRLAIPLVGGSSHRFNLEVNQFLAESENLIAQVQELMIQLRLPNNAAVLARHTRLHAVRANVTRWSSKFDMLDRYLAIRDAIRCVPAVEELVPRSSAHRRIVVLHEKLQELNSVCLKLQSEKRTLSEVRALFDACLEKYPVMDKLKARAKVVHSASFESGIVKVTNGLPLTSAELKCLAPFRQEVQAQEVERTDCDFATEILRRAKKPRRAERGLTLADYVPPLMTIPRRATAVSGCSLNASIFALRIDPP